MARRKNPSPEDTVLLLQRCAELLEKGPTIELACREVGISSPTYYKSWQRDDGISIDNARELKELRIENAKLERLVAELELELEKLMLKEIAKRKL